MKYEIGDIVITKSEYDEGKNGTDYSVYFNPLMLEHGGKPRKILDKRYSSEWGFWLYTLENAGPSPRCGIYAQSDWDWTEDMFLVKDIKII